MLLKRIARQLPPYLADLLPALEAVEIRTTENILFTPLSTVQSHVPAIPRHLLDLLSAHCLSLTATPSISGDQDDQLYSRVASTSSWPGWGLDDLDTLVGAWDGTGVLELAGPKRAGKSLLALHAVLRVLQYDPRASCLWLDTGGGFDPKRAQAILDAWGVKDAASALDRITVTRCFSLEPDVYDAIGKMEIDREQVEQVEGEGERPIPKILVIDSVTSLFKDTLMPTTSQGHAAMINLMTDITSSLTYKYGILTIITNATSSSLPINPLSFFSATTVKPALGTAFTYHVDISLLLQETGKVFGLVDEEERDRVRKAPGLRGIVEVIKSRVSPSGKWAVFETDGVQLFNVSAPSREDERTIRMSAGVPAGDPRPRMGPLRETLAP